MRDLLDELDDARHVNRVNAVWVQFTRIMTGRALVRVLAAAAWTIVAVADGSRFWWLGVMGTVAAGVSMLHARKDVLEKLFDWSDTQSPSLALILRWCFPFPAENHAVELPGYLEGLSVAAIAVATGWFGVIDDPIYAAAATACAYAYGATFFVNLAAHPSYVMAARPNRLLQAAAVALSATSILWLWPQSGPESLRVLAVLGEVVVVVYVVWGIRELDLLSDGLAETIGNVEARTLLRVSEKLHTELKNPAEALVNEVQEFDRMLGGPGFDAGASEKLLHRALSVNRSSTFMASRISQWVESTRASQFAPTYSATDLVWAVLRLWPDAEERYVSCVEEDFVDPRGLSRIDRNLLTSCISELVTNATVADAEALRVRFRPTSLPREASGVELLVECCCRTSVAEGRPRVGTLGLLADRLEFYGGGLAVMSGETDANSEGLREHSFRAWWPIGT